jgi:hypothetical protein
MRFAYRNGFSQFGLPHPGSGERQRLAIVQSLALDVLSSNEVCAIGFADS